MIPSALTDRLREASLHLDPERVAELDSALERAGTARLTVEDVIARAQLAHLIHPDPGSIERFLTPINKEAELVAESDLQLIAVLATMAMINSFAREPSRSAAVMRRVVIGALAVRTLSRSHFSPAHPDLQTWADYLLISHGRRVRETKGIQPPTLAEPITLAEGQERTREQGIDDGLERLETYAKETGDWLELSAGAGSIGAIREQGQVLWWLLNRQPAGEPSEEAIRAARELSRVSLIPPLPASGELLKRRLVLLGEGPVDAEEFERYRGSDETLAAAARTAPYLTPILAGGIRTKTSAAELSHAIYEELMLAAMITDERARAEEQIRRATEQREREKAEQKSQ